MNTNNKKSEMHSVNEDMYSPFFYIGRSNGLD
jgi:hypothetical protein